MNTGTIPVARCIGNAALFGRNRCIGKVTTAAAAADRASSVCSGSANGSKKIDYYYKVLSLEPSPAIGADEIKRAYRRLALQCHPDVCPPLRRAESTEFFLELRRAYETLSDPAQRSRYDTELRIRRRGSGGGQAAARVTTGGEFAAFAGRDVWEAQLCVLRARSERRHRATTRGAAAGTVMAHA